MTPAIVAAKALGIACSVHEYQHDPATRSYGLEAADKLGVPAQRVLKTLVVALEPAELAVAVLPVTEHLSLKACARALGAKKSLMADPKVVQRATGYVLGGVSPLGQRKRLRTVIDASARHWPSVFVSAGRRGLDLELAPDDLALATAALWARLGEIRR